ncbi:VENN motif pre-toxin domain-containing protein, partial [Escherichia coli]|nr:VENN motif pre-toxin domain-containing protein [Escherichia coli]EHH5203042.1 VENN motif pre-toxin domain-containing protein [Escherichia coli]EHI0157891.1 VENN motif pre-toxin domain-containing protein [Escherichia coli]
DGGFDITVGRHTQLEGAVIASTATPDKNHLDTGTLGFSDLHNEADYKVSHSGIRLSGGGSFGDKFQGNMPGGMMSAGGHSGHAEGTTQAAVAEGTITIRDRDNQKQNLANLSRDPAHANDSISPIFDKEKEQRRLQTVGLISDIGSQVADIARTQGELNVLKAAKEAIGEVLPANATEKQRQEYLAKLRDTQAYRNEMAKYGTGSEIQRGIQAATAALQGLAGDNLAGALAGASAPELAHLLKSTEKDPAVNAIAHAILGGAVAAMQGNNIAAGAAGAATGELAARAIAGMLYPGVKQSDLSEEQKQTISTLATVSAGLAGGLTGNSTASAAVGAQSGKNAVENNLLGGSEWLQTEKAREHGADVLSCSDNPSGEACKRGQAENKAYAAALATSSVSLLPRSAQAMWALGAGANAGIGSMVDSSVDPENAIIAGWVNVITMGQGWKGTVGWNAAGGAFGNWLDGKDPLSGAAMSGGTSAIGYGVGKVVQGPLEKVINPNWKNWEWLNVGMGISKPLPLNPTPGIAGNIGSSIGSEGSGAIIQEQLKNQQEKK